jgi:flagellar biogenesis protein FliO
MMREMMNNCCGGMGMFMWIGGLLVLIILILLVVWLIKQIKK